MLLLLKCPSVEPSWDYFLDMVGLWHYKAKTINLCWYFSLICSKTTSCISSNKVALDISQLLWVFQKLYFGFRTLHQNSQNTELKIVLPWLFFFGCPRQLSAQSIAGFFQPRSYWAFFLEKTSTKKFLRLLLCIGNFLQLLKQSFFSVAISEFSFLCSKLMVGLFHQDVLRQIFRRRIDLENFVFRYIAFVLELILPGKICQYLSSLVLFPSFFLKKCLEAGTLKAESLLWMSKGTEI